MSMLWGTPTISAIPRCACGTEMAPPRPRRCSPEKPIRSSSRAWSPPAISCRDTACASKWRAPTSRTMSAISIPAAEIPTKACRTSRGHGYCTMRETSRSWNSAPCRADLDRGMATQAAGGGRPTALPALRVAAVQAGMAAVHHDHRGRAALGAELRAVGKMRLRKCVRLPGPRFEFRALFLHQLALVLVELGLFEQADRLEVPFDDVAQFRNRRGHELPAGLPVAALRIEHRLELIDQKRRIAALAKHRRNDPRQCDDPLEVVEILGVDEHLERSPLLVLRPLVEQNVVDRDIHGMVGNRRLDLVRRADQHVGPLELLVHPDDVVLGLRRLLGGRRRAFRFRLLHAVLGDLLVDFNVGHDQNFP